jgi:Flp pilus assembly protein TadD
MRKSLALALVLVFASAANLFAVGEARLNGRVLDAAGNPIADAKITVTAMSGKTFKKTFNSNAKGEYAIFLIDGTIQYEFLFEKEGLAGYKEVMKLKLIPEKNIKDITLGKGGAVASVAVVDAKPDPSVVAYNEGVQLINAGDEKGGIAKIEEALTLNDDLTAGHIALAKLYTKNKEWQKAITHAERALVLSPDESDMNTVLFQAYDKTGNKAKAAEYKSKAPANARILFNDAAKLINEGKAAQAEPMLRQVVELEPDFAPGHYELGMLLAGMSKNADARTHLQKYLELEPNGKDAATAKEMLNYVK